MISERFPDSSIESTNNKLNIEGYNLKRAEFPGNK